MTLAESVANFKAENHRGALQAIADDLAGRLPSASNGEAPTIAKQLAQTLADIKALPPPEGDPVADILAERAKRTRGAVDVPAGRQGASDPARAWRRGVAGNGS